MKTPDHIQKAREAHHAALERLTGKPGLATWRKLRRLEAKASAITLELCNGTLDQERCDQALDDISRQVQAIIGRPFYLNRDPRGYALKLEGVPDFGLHRDWGGYQILAPCI